MYVRENVYVSKFNICFYFKAACSIPGTLASEAVFIFQQQNRPKKKNSTWNLINNRSSVLS